MSRLGTGTACLLLAATIGFAGCNPIYYSPNTQNVLMPETRGDVSLAGTSGGENVQLQAAYAVTDDVALQLNGGIFGRDENDGDDGGAGTFIEVGAGYTGGEDAGVSWEIVGLLGAGSVENDFPSTIEDSPETTGQLRADLLRFGVQPAFGYRSKFVDVAASTRLVGLSYRNVEGSLIYRGEDQVAMLSDGNRYFLVEPAVTLRAGLENMKLQVQAGRSFNLTDRDFRQDEVMFSVGVVVGLSTRR